ncbi:spore germination protein GerPB [Radiobacillus kanasensis]|uniref:spore germination protein GerPB n=1 Tax=Radiobacillus kanasensis TaxID=2844358 RepID=UPI001E316145|nr:spore germination protein GerPB [Radiobacillus kanasensis]UFU00527.1 spore germination protein GerPB [Radiobacillus kanasensis]
MNITVYQTVHINLLKVENVSNSSVLQIGTAGQIHAQSDLHNTGGFFGEAQQALTEDDIQVPLVPLAPPS